MTFVTHCTCIKVLLPNHFKEPITGVDLFFVISGFVVTGSLLRSLPALSHVQSFSERINLCSHAIKCFFMRRIFRILPPAYFWMLFYLALAVIFGKDSAYLVGTPSEIFKEIVHVSSGFYNYLGYKDDIAIHHLGPYWSLAVEEHFYLLLPILLIFVASRHGRIFGCIVVILVVAGILRPFINSELLDPLSFQIFTSHRRFDTLALGVMLALIKNPQIKNEKQVDIKSPFFIKIMLHLLPLIFIVLLWCSPSMFPPPFKYSFGLTIYGLYALGLVFLASFERGYIFNYKYINRILEYIGERSYTLYLSHVGIICLDILFSNWLTLHYPTFSNWFLQRTSGILIHFSLLLIVAIAISDIMYRLIEKPMIKYAKERYS